MSTAAKKKMSAAPRVRALTSVPEPASKPAFPDKEVSMDTSENEIVVALNILGDLRDGLDGAAAAGIVADPAEFVATCQRVHQIKVRLDNALESLRAARQERAELARDWLEQ